MVGRVLNSRYELQQLVGTGGMADVYRSTDNLLGRTVAVKILHSQYSKDPVFIQRFRQEAQAAAHLNHPNIVNVYDWGNEGDLYFIVMEFVEGPDLKDIILRSGPLLPERAVEFAVAICAALDAAHAQGIVHRDIKPQNVIVTGDNQVKVMDFGIARAAGGSAMTQTGTIMGTPQYISPEQAQGRSADPRSDLYSLGVLLYEMLTGKAPFDGDNPVSIAYKHVREDPLPPTMINPDISPELEAVVLKALSKNPENRYQTAPEMRADLERCLEGAPVFATPVLSAEELAQGYAQAYPARAAPRRRRSYAWIWIIVILLVLAGAGVGAWALIKNATEVKVPNVVGETKEKAKKLLEAAGLKLGTVGEDYSESVEAGKIARQDPTDKEKTSKGEAVKVWVSKGTKMVSVPELMGRTPDEAQVELKKIGLKLGKQTTGFSSAVPKGKISGQDPPSASKVLRGSEVDVVLSQGPQMVAVPNVTGKTQEDASAELSRVGFQVSVKETQTSNPQQDGKVISQSPEAGQLVAKGSGVTINIGKRPEQVKVPNVVNELKADAQQILQAAGFIVSVKEQAVTDTTKVGKVISQSPDGGTMYDKGGTVTITVGKKATP